jgi:hypothetical protein
MASQGFGARGGYGDEHRLQDLPPGTVSHHQYQNARPFCICNSYAYCPPRSSIRLTQQTMMSRARCYTTTLTVAAPLKIRMPASPRRLLALCRRTA